MPWAPLEDGERARSFLDALVAIDPRIKGIRRLYQSEPDIDFCIRPDFIRGVQICCPSTACRSTSALINQQLPDTITLVRACPNVSFVLDHIGKPDIKGRHAGSLARRDPRACGVPERALQGQRHGHRGRHRSAGPPTILRPYVEHVLESFGEDRVMFGGDWPVVLMASPYRRWVETLDELTAGLSDAAKRKLWNENARRFYRVDQGWSGHARFTGSCPLSPDYYFASPPSERGESAWSRAAVAPASTGSAIR